MPIRAALFDFDGTLADSFEAITSSTNHVRERYGLPAVTEEVVREYVGLGLPNLMQTMVPTAPTEEAVAAYREHHPSVMLTGTRLLPGVGETLRELHRRGLRMAVCSNKAVAFTKDLVRSLQIADYFAAVLGPDDVAGRPKPDPAMLLEGLTRLEVSSEESVYVGDMWIDVQAGRAAKIPTWLVLGGAVGQQSATDAGPEKVLARFSELRELLG